jgi:hypothetical protein
MGALELEFVVLIACFAGAAAWYMWRLSGGETVGVVRGLAQGESTVPGLTVRAVVKRYIAGGTLDRAELQFRILFGVRKYTLQPDEAAVLARALEEAVAQARKAQ